MKLFIDTNIFLDLFLERWDFNSIYNLFNLWENFSFFTSDKSLLDFFYIARKATDKQKALLYIKNIIYAFEIFGWTKKNFIDMLENNNFTDFEDSFQHEIAKNAKVDFIITNNKKDFKNSQIRAFTAKEFLEFDF